MLYNCTPPSRRLTIYHTGIIWMIKIKLYLMVLNQITQQLVSCVKLNQRKSLRVVVEGPFLNRKNMIFRLLLIHVIYKMRVDMISPENSI